MSTFRWTAASPDAWWRNSTGELCVLEVKTTNPRAYLEDWGKDDGSWEDVVPKYVGQLLWQYYVLECDHLWIAADCGTAMKTMYCPLTEHWRKEMDTLKNKCYALWLEHIASQVMAK